MKTIALALALSVAAGTAALATELDGDNNPVPGAQMQIEGAFANTYAYMMPSAYDAEPRSVPVIVRKLEIDSDGNPIPGLH